MATAPVTPVKETGLQKFENFFEKFGHDLEVGFNVAENIALQELPVIAPLLPPATYNKVATFVNAAAQQVAAVDQKYAAIGKSNVPFAVKVAEAVAVGGSAVIALAAEAGLQIVNVSQFFTAASQLAQSLNLQNVTAPPTPPVAS